MSTRVVRLLLSNDVLIGKGTDGSPFRKGWTLYTLDGQWVGQFDPDPDNDGPHDYGWHDAAQLRRLMTEGK